MKKTVLNFVGFFVAVLVSINLFAYDFEVDGIYYNINADNTTVSVTCKDKTYNSYSGDVTIPATVTYDGTTYNVTAIGAYAFCDCAGLTSVSIANSVTTIGTSAFQGCSSLTTIEIPHSVTTMENDVFNSCEGLTNVIIGNGITTISQYAFYHCEGLARIEIPHNVTTIEYAAFGYCIALDSIFCKATEHPTLSTYGDVFLNTPENKVFIVPCGVQETYKSADGWKDFTDIIEDCSGIEEIAHKNAITIYPNPAHDKVTIEGKGEITITNSLGQVVKEIKDNNVYKTIDIKDLESGVYYIKIGNTTQKLVVE